MHAGTHRYTVGQRHGLGITAREPLYVLETDAAANVVRVGPRSELLAGEIYLSPAISKQVVAAYLQRVGGELISPFERLTPRQREVLQMVAEGNTTKEIARTLGLSVKTVDNHRTNLMRKLNLHDVASLTRYALDIGLIEPKKTT